MFSILILGFAATMVWATFDIVSDELTPIMLDLGYIPEIDTNLSHAAEVTFGTLDIFIQAIPWIIALGYIMSLVFSIVFVFIVGDNPHPAFIGLYFGLMILLIFGAIFISNMYEDVYEKDDEIATRLQEQVTMSYLILHSPWIMAFITIFAGVLMFTRQGGSEGGGTGGFGI